MEAVKHQGKKGKGNSLDEVGETAGESAKTVQRYIYLAHLSDALLDMVDKKKIGIVQGCRAVISDRTATGGCKLFLKKQG